MKKYLTKSNIVLGVGILFIIIKFWIMFNYGVGGSELANALNEAFFLRVGVILIIVGLIMKRKSKNKKDN